MLGDKVTSALTIIETDKERTFTMLCVSKKGTKVAAYFINVSMSRVNCNCVKIKGSCLLFHLNITSS